MGPVTITLTAGWLIEGYHDAWLRMHQHTLQSAMASCMHIHKQGNRRAGAWRSLMYAEICVMPFSLMMLRYLQEVHFCTVPELHEQRAEMHVQDEFCPCFTGSLPVC